MKKVNFKKLTNQFLAGLFGLALMGGVMLNTQEAEAQQPENLEIVDVNPNNSQNKGKRAKVSPCNINNMYLTKTTCHPVKEQHFC